MTREQRKLNESRKEIDRMLNDWHQGWPRFGDVESKPPFSEVYEEVMKFKLLEVFDVDSVEEAGTALLHGCDTDDDDRDWKEDWEEEDDDDQDLDWENEDDESSGS